MVGLLVLGSAIWFAWGWVDAPGDNTCVPFRPDLWADRRGCTPVMTLRLVAATAFAGLGLMLTLAGIAGHRWVKRHPGRAAAAIICATLATTALLTVNEIIRSHGLFN
jgi:hypothetical protein